MTSTAIRGLLYNPEKRELSVTFFTGRRYVYANVPSEVFEAFRNAASRGAFFSNEIRDRYAHRATTRSSGVKRERCSRRG
jgi:hypothetical protein